MTVEYSPLQQVSNPVEAYAYLRERCPVHRWDGWGPPLFTLSRYEDVRAVLRDPRRRSPFHDMPSRAQDLVAALVDGRDHLGSPFPDDAIVPVVMLVLFGAIHTTATLLTNSVFRLLEDRARWAALCADPTLAATEIEESARLDAPVPGIYRTTTSPVCLHGVEIPSDAKVKPLFAAANRDPVVFTDPDSYRLDRDPAELARQHFSVGLGVHLCAGAPLARLDGRTLLRVLTERLPGLQEGPVLRWWAERDTITLTRPHRLAPATARPVWSSRTPEPSLPVEGMASP
jgi:cytochrome P450